MKRYQHRWQSALRDSDSNNISKPRSHTRDSTVKLHFSPNDNKILKYSRALVNDLYVHVVTVYVLRKIVSLRHDKTSHIKQCNNVHVQWHNTYGGRSINWLLQWSYLSLTIYRTNATEAMMTLFVTGQLGSPCTEPYWLHTSLNTVKCYKIFLIICLPRSQLGREIL